MGVVQEERDEAQILFEKKKPKISQMWWKTLIYRSKNLNKFQISSKRSTSITSWSNDKKYKTRQSLKQEKQNHVQESSIISDGDFSQARKQTDGKFKVN